MKAIILPVVCLVIMHGSVSCKQRSQTEQTEATTFVLSDTMLSTIRIDTTVVRPVESELRLPGEVTPEKVRNHRQVWITTSIPDSGAAKIREGDMAEVTTASYPDTIFRGQVDKVYGEQDTTIRTVKVRIKLDNKGSLLKPEMVANVRFRYRDGNEMASIPSSAVIFDKGRNFVLVFRDKFNIDTREVKVAKSLDNITYISKGLEPGDMVISKNQLSIYDALHER